MTPPLIARIAALRARRDTTAPHTIEWHELHTEVRALERQFLDEHVAAYLAGEADREPRPWGEHGLLTSAELLATVLAPHLEAFTAEDAALALPAFGEAPVRQAH